MAVSISCSVQALAWVRMLVAAQILEVQAVVAHSSETIRPLPIEHETHDKLFQADHMPLGLASSQCTYAN